APIGEPRRRQQEKKFLQVQTFDRALDGELGSDLRDVLHDAVAPPGPVDPHHLGRYPALEYDAIAFASLVARHHARSLQPVRLRPPASQDTGALLTAGKSGARRRDVGEVPVAQMGERRMRQRPVEIGPDARLVAQILRLAVAAVEAGKGAEQARIPL